MNFRRIFYPVLACASVVLSGCSVTPEPYTQEQIEEIAKFDRELIFQSQEELSGPLTLGRAMSMALKYNLENRVRLLEEAVANQTIDLAQMDLLPSLAATAGYLDRNNVNASSSQSVLTGEESLEVSTSQDTERFNANGRFTWNMLDFGVSYLQAKQDADRYLIAQKVREKVMLTLLQEVRGAYWKAVAMERMRSELDDLSFRVDEMLANLEAVREQQLRTPVAVLTDIRALIGTSQQLDQIRRSIDTAQARLASLVNAPSYKALDIPVPESLPELVEVSDDVERMELLALTNSADYAGEVYKVRIDQLESRKAMLRLLPGLEFSYGESYDDNSFLFNNQWGEFGLNLTGDIGQLFFTNRIKKFRETNEELTLNRKLAMNMAVITGVHITWQDYKNASIGLQRAEYLQEIDEEISALTQNAESNLIGSGAQSIQNELRAFRSRIGQMQTYADAQAAYGALLVSLGLNPIPYNYQQYSVDELAEEVAENFDEVIFPLTKQGEALIAERRELDEWVRQRQIQEQIRMEREEALQREIERQQMIEREMQLAKERELMMIREEELLAMEEARTAAGAAAAEEAIARAKAEAAIEEEAPLDLPPAEDPVARVEEEVVLANRTPVEDLPIQASTMSPDISRFVRDFIIKYFPTPNLDSYVRQFTENQPDGPSQVDYLEEFLMKLPAGPDKDAYIDLFIENLPAGPDQEDYLKMFREQRSSAPSSMNYLDEFKSRSGT